MRNIFRLSHCLTMLNLFAGACPAQAEFQLAGPAVSAPPADLAPALAGDPSAEARARKPTLRPSIPLAVGFGEQVPLGFAMRQIVPHGIRVSFAAGLDPEAILVDWKGGRPWPEVVRAVLRKPGLRVTFRPGAVQIQPIEPS